MYKEEFENFNSKLNEIEKDLKVIETNIKHAEKDIEDLNKKLEEIEKLKKEEKILHAFLNFMKEVKEKFGKNGMQKDISQTFFPVLETYTNNLFSTFSFPYDGVEIFEDEENCHINLKKKGISIPSASLSGGEKCALSIALNAALAHIIGKSDFLILDEPTESLDEGKVDELIDILREFKGITQLIVISHDREFKNAARTRIEIYKENGISRIVGEENEGILKV